MAQQIKVRFRDTTADLEQPGDWSFLKSHRIGIWLHCVCGIVNPISGRTIVCSSDGLSITEKLMCPACLAQIEICKDVMTVTHSKEGEVYGRSLKNETR